MGEIKKNILITGANGFIGKNLCEQLKHKYNLLAPLRAELNLLDENKVNEYFKKTPPNMV